MASRCPPALLRPVLWPLLLFLRVTSSGCPRFEVSCQGYTVLQSLSFTPAQVSPGITVTTASCKGTELLQGPDHFRLYRKILFLKSRNRLCSNDKILFFPPLWCRMFMGIFLQAFSFQYKTQLALSRDLWWKGGQGGTQGLYLLFKAGYCKRLRTMGRGVNTRVQAQLYATPWPLKPFAGGHQVFQSASYSQPPQHLPALQLLSSDCSYQPLPPSFPRKPPPTGLYLAEGSAINFNLSRGSTCLQQAGILQGCIPQPCSSVVVCPQAEAGMGSCLMATGLFG